MLLSVIPRSSSDRHRRGEIVPQRFFTLLIRPRVALEKKHQFMSRSGRILCRQVTRELIDNNERLDRFDLRETFVDRCFVSNLRSKNAGLISEQSNLGGNGRGQSLNSGEIIDWPKITGRVRQDRKSTR